MATMLKTTFSLALQQSIMINTASDYYMKLYFFRPISEVEITKDEESNIPRKVGMSELSGDESQDAATVCRWFASR